MLARPASSRPTVRGSVAATLLAVATSAVATPVLHRCELSDGQVRTLMVDPGAFPMSLGRCSAVSAGAAAAAPARPVQVPASFVQTASVETAARVLPSSAIDIGRRWQWYGSSRGSVAQEETVAKVIEAPAIDTGRGWPRYGRFRGGFADGGQGAAVDLPQGARPFSDLVHTASRRYRLDARLLHAIIRVESNGNPHARSKAGALGLMQVMPGTGARYGVKNPAALMQPDVNIDVGARYLSDLSRMFGDRLDLVVAAYNAGEGAVIRYGRAIPPYAETQDYVQRVLGRLEGGGRMP